MNAARLITSTAACNQKQGQYPLNSLSLLEYIMPQSITVGTVSTAASSAFTAATPSATSLQAQLDRFQKQLSDCVNCASAKTPQGKADIQAISARISQVEQRIAERQDRAGSAGARSLDTPTATAPSVAASASAYTSSIDVFA